MTLLKMSLSGGCVILAGTLLRALAKDRLPRWTYECMWALAVLRLTVPVRLPFRFSAWTLLERSAPAAVSPAVQGTGAATPLVDITTSSVVASPTPGTSPWTILWAGGAVLLALILAAGYIHSYCRFREVEEVDINFSNLLPEIRLPRRNVAMRVTDRAGAPLTYGVIRPVILLPRALDRTEGGPLGFVLAHELAHIRRLDALRKLVLAGVTCVHWFNPLVWLMLVLANRDMELACDQAVVRALGSDIRRDYAHVLLDMEARRAGLTGFASGFSRNAIEERIHSIMKTRKRPFWSVLLALALVLSVGAAFATAAPEPADADAAAPGTFTGEILASSDGTVYVYTAGGEPIAMTREEYEALIDPVEVQWWTAEEYAAWLEQEKKDLQDCLGQRAWTNTDGWFTWTQEKIDETIKMYEQTLEDIQNGLLVSKTVDGSDDVMLAQGDDREMHLMTGAEDAPEDETVAPVSLAEQVSALIGGDGTTLPGCTDFRGRLGPYEKIYFDVGWVDEDGTVTAAVSADKKIGCHVSICPAGEGPGDYLTAVDPDQAASGGAAEPASGGMLSSSGLRPGRYAVCVWSSVNEPIEFALSYMVS